MCKSYFSALEKSIQICLSWPDEKKTFKEVGKTFLRKNILSWGSWSFFEGIFNFCQMLKRNDFLSNFYCAEVVGYWGIKPLRRFPCWGEALKAPLLPPLVPLIKHKKNSVRLATVKYRIKISCQIGYCGIKNKGFMSN